MGIYVCAFFNVFTMLSDKEKYKVEWNYAKVEYVKPENVIYVACNRLACDACDISDDNRKQENYAFALRGFGRNAFVNGNRPG